jgi:hypothetical protein
MQKLYNILLTVLAIALFGHSLVAEQPLTEKGAAAVASASDHGNQSTNPLAQPNLHNVYLPVESGINVLTTIPVPYISGEDQEESAVHKFIVRTAQNRAREYLHCYKLANRVATVLKLIFPFHSFL